MSIAKKTTKRKPLSKIEKLAHEMIRRTSKDKVEFTVQTKYNSKNTKKWDKEGYLVQFDPSIHKADVILYEIRSVKHGHITEFSWVQAAEKYSQAVKKPWWFLVKVKVRHAKPK